jgi:hypothetical protein
MDLSARLGDAFDVGLIARDILRHVGDDRERGDHLRLLLRRGNAWKAERQTQDKNSETYEFHSVEPLVAIHSQSNVAAFRHLSTLLQVIRKKNLDAGICVGIGPSCENTASY